MTSEDRTHVSRVLLLGESGIGKTSLARTITQGSFPAISSLDALPKSHSFEFQTTPETSIKAGDVCHIIRILDNEGALPNGEAWQGGQVDVVYLCFDICRRVTFDAIQTKWLPMAQSVGKRKKGGMSFFLVGLKADEVTTHSNDSSQTDPQSSQPIPTHTANDLANHIGAFMYVEVSALKHLGIQKLKEQTIFCRRIKDTAECLDKKSKCILM